MQVLPPSGPLEIGLFAESETSKAAEATEATPASVATSAVARSIGRACVGADLGSNMGELTEAGVCGALSMLFPRYSQVVNRRNLSGTSRSNFLA